MFTLRSVFAAFRVLRGRPAQDGGRAATQTSRSHPAWAQTAATRPPDTKPTF